MINSTAQMNMANDFIGVKVGDVDNSIDLSSQEDLLNIRSGYDIYYSLETSSKEHQQLIPVFSNEVGLIYGFQFTLSLADGTILDVLPGDPRAEIYIGESLATKVPSLSLYDDTGKSQFVLYQNEPNPFKESTEIKFYLPEKQEITLSFYGTNGVKIYSIIDVLDEGLHSYKLSADQFEAANVVYYKLSSELYNDSKKMIIVK